MATTTTTRDEAERQGSDGGECKTPNRKQMSFEPSSASDCSELPSSPGSWVREGLQVTVELVRGRYPYPDYLLAVFPRYNGWMVERLPSRLRGGWVKIQNAEVSDECPPLTPQTEKPRTGTRSLH